MAPRARPHLLVERALSDGELKVLKNRRQPRTIRLLAPLREDLADWRAACPSRGPVFASSSGGFWRASDWRNWRKRIYKPVAEAVGIDGARPYHLRHAFASLLIHEGRLSVVEIAAQLGHNPTVCLDTYAHVMAERTAANGSGPRSRSPPRDERWNVNGPSRWAVQLESLRARILMPASPAATRHQVPRASGVAGRGSSRTTGIT